MKIWRFSGIFFILFLTANAFATDNQVVASKAYVDAMDQEIYDYVDEGLAERQYALPEGTSGSVVIYDGFDDDSGQNYFGEVAIYNGENDYDDSDDSGSLVTAGVVANFAATVEGITYQNTTFSPVNEDGTACTGNSCSLYVMTTTDVPLTDEGTFAPLTSVSCKNYDEYSLSPSGCCSGVLQLGVSASKCGCFGLGDCPNGFCNTSTHTCSGKLVDRT